MKIFPIHTQAIMEFGYTEEEARFLYLVATRSGYFTCQQFLKFIQAKPGKRSITFARKVTEMKHATSKEHLRNGRVITFLYMKPSEGTMSVSAVSRLHGG